MTEAATTETTATTDTTAAIDTTATTTPTSLLNPAAGDTAANDNWLPEKFHVKKDDGSIDVEASSRKLAESYSHAEKRIGSGDLPPKDVSEYKVSFGEGVEIADFDASQDAGIQAFLGDALASGMTQKQIDIVMSKVPDLIASARQAFGDFDVQSATESLQQVWTTPAEMDANLRAASAAASSVGKRAGVSIDDMKAAGLDNNPAFLRIMASLAPEFGEDKPLHSTTISDNEQQTIDGLMTSEAYINPRHVDHARVSAQVNKFFSTKYGGSASL